jgi:hypothetical protein
VAQLSSASAEGDVAGSLQAPENDPRAVSGHTRFTLSGPNRATPLGLNNLKGASVTFASPAVAAVFFGLPQPLGRLMCGRGEHAK